MHLWEWRGGVNARLRAIEDCQQRMKTEMDVMTHELQKMAIKFEGMATKIAFIGGVGALVGGGLVHILSMWFNRVH